MLGTKTVSRIWSVRVSKENRNSVFWGLLFNIISVKQYDGRHIVTIDRLRMCVRNAIVCVWKYTGGILVSRRLIIRNLLM